MPSVNEALFDAANRHQIFLIRLGGASAKKILRLLGQADAELVTRLARRIDRLGPLDRQVFGQGRATTERLMRLLEEIREQSRDVRNAMRQALRGDLLDLAGTELDIASRRLSEAVGVDLGILRPSPELLRAAVDGAVIRGQTLRQWFTKLGDDRLRRVDSAVRLGLVTGETTPQIISRVREQMRVTARSAEALTRTAVNATANQARDFLYQANDDLIKGLRWTSTLDGRTSAICQARDGMVFPIDSGPRPPAHPNCRSIMVPATKSWDELAKPDALKRGRGAERIDTLFRKKLRARGFSRAEAERVMRNARASMNGQVPGDLSYGQWLKRQPVEFQDDVLGQIKGRLFRKGGVTLDRFVDRTGKSFTLDDLKRRELAAWSRAGLPLDEG